MTGRALLLLLAAIMGGALLLSRVVGYGPARPASLGDDSVVMISAEWCGTCKLQIAEFDASGIRYTVLDYDTQAGRRAYRDLNGRVVPITVVGKDVVTGYNKRRLQYLLAQQGQTLR